MARATFSDFIFDAASPEAVRVAKLVAAKLVREVSNETRIAIRQAIVSMLQDQRLPIEAAREILGTLSSQGIRVGGVAGLTRKQRAAVRNFRDNLQNIGMNPTLVAAKTRKFAEKMLRDRASNIARTETMNALNTGQLEAWKQQQKSGLLAKNASKEWIVTPDDRLCQICAPLDGEIVPINKQFSIGVDAPPAHPRCRCSHGVADPFGERTTSIDRQARIDADFDADAFRERTGATVRPFSGQ